MTRKLIFILAVLLVCTGMKNSNVVINAAEFVCNRDNCESYRDEWCEERGHNCSWLGHLWGSCTPASATVSFSNGWCGGRCADGTTIMPMRCTPGSGG